VPVGSDESVAMLEQEAERVVCLTIPRRLYGVGMWYRDFSPVSDEQVVELMATAGPRSGRHETASGENASGGNAPGENAPGENAPGENGSGETPGT